MVLIKMIRFVKYDHPTLYQETKSISLHTEERPPGTRSKKFAIVLS